MSIIATYRAATLVVAAAMMNVATARHKGMVMWKNRSPVLSACQALANVVMTPSTYGGLVRMSVRMLLYPRVFTTVGKKFVTEAAATLPKTSRSYAQGQQIVLRHEIRPEAGWSKTHQHPGLDILER